MIVNLSLSFTLDVGMRIPCCPLQIFVCIMCICKRLWRTLGNLVLRKLTFDMHIIIKVPKSYLFSSWGRYIFSSYVFPFLFPLVTKVGSDWVLRFDLPYEEVYKDPHQIELIFNELQLGNFFCCSLPSYTRTPTHTLLSLYNIFFVQNILFIHLMNFGLTGI